MPFGGTSIRVLKGERNDAHYGWGGIIPYPGGKWVKIYRRAAHHGIQDGSDLRAADSYNQGKTWTNDRLVYRNTLSDARPDAPVLMANNRGGFFVNRPDEAGTHFSPLFINSDDEFVTWTADEVVTSSPYTFSSNGGMIAFPASQGGHDTLGFIAFGFLSSGGYDALHTSDNGDTWQITHEVAQAVVPITGLSEWAGGRIGNSDRWIFYLRNKDANGWRSEAACFTTTNLLNWGNPKPSGKNLGGNPPCVISDPCTGMYHFLAFGRGGRDIDGFDHHMLIASADGDALWNAGGNWAALTPAVDWSVVTPVPNWATGYLAPFQVGGSWWGTFVAAEPGSSGGNRSIIAMIGDFHSTDADRTLWMDMFTRNAIFDVLRAGYQPGQQPTEDAAISAAVRGANSPGIMTESFGSASRTHYSVRNNNGKVGSTTAGGTATQYNET